VTTYHVRHNPFRKLTMAAGTLALVGGLSVAPTAQAASPSIDQQILNTLSTAHSYEVVLDSKGSDATSTFHADVITVRHGNAAQTYAKFTGAALSMQLAMSGNKICVNVVGPWTCTPAASSPFGSLLKFTPADLLKPLGGQLKLTPIGSKTIAGHHAAGYSFTAATSVGASKGTLWVDPATKRVIELDTTVNAGIMGQTTTASIKALVTHWNDPKLAIPSVPGL
jgi:hypothetical protein